MRTGKSKFSLIEVIVVLMILVLIMTLAIRNFQEKNPGQVVIEMSDTLKQVFNNASIRAQSFQVHVKVKVVVKDDESLVCYIEMVNHNPELPSKNPDDMTEEERQSANDKEYNVRMWSGEDDYELPPEVKITEYEELVNDNKEIFFDFYPDGEATGPDLNVSVGDRKFKLTVDRLMGQLVLFENEEI